MGPCTPAPADRTGTDSTNVMFRQRRLVLLGKAGVERILLDAEWAELQRNFPDDASVQASKSESDASRGCRRAGRHREIVEPGNPVVALVAGDHGAVPTRQKLRVSRHHDRQRGRGVAAPDPVCGVVAAEFDSGE